MGEICVTKVDVNGFLWTTKSITNSSFVMVFFKGLGLGEVRKKLKILEIKGCGVGF